MSVSLPLILIKKLFLKNWNLEENLEIKKFCILRRKGVAVAQERQWASKKTSKHLTVLLQFTSRTALKTMQSLLWLLKWNYTEHITRIYMNYLQRRWNKSWSSKVKLKSAMETVIAWGCIYRASHELNTVKIGECIETKEKRNGTSTNKQIIPTKNFGGKGFRGTGISGRFSLTGIMYAKTR